MDTDMDDVHLCIKCKERIEGLDNYIEHRKENCSILKTSSSEQLTENTTSTTTTPTSETEARNDVTPAITYEPFHFIEPEPANTTSLGGKTSKALAESYGLHYDLNADVFFSSLQLQSVQSATSGGKTGSSHFTGPLTRQKLIQLDAEAHASSSSEMNWTHAATPHQNRGENFLKETIFEKYEHDSPEITEEEEDEEELEVDISDDDEDFDPMSKVHGTAGKWKVSIMRQSPPVVPISHTGGKWKPENRPNLRAGQIQLSRASSTWDDADVHEADVHPPDDYTQGKWIPGSKIQKLDYKDDTEQATSSKTSNDYWCNICCRKLKNKIIYDNHLKSSYHLKRSEPEQQLEKAIIIELPKAGIKRSLPLATFEPLSITISMDSKKRTRRCTYLKCSLCKHIIAIHLIGKHLISHYHYRRMQLYPGISTPMILEYIHAIVLQSPFQCRPCRFYANTEEMFLLHWNSASHLDASQGPGCFCCSYCSFECEDNNQMHRHLLGPEHKEVLLAINRSVPICISKRLNLDCTKCSQSFLYNFELRRHFINYHQDLEFPGTASDTYQSKFRCTYCPDILTSKTALQRHEKFKHCVYKFFCDKCNLEFKSACQARRHRKTLEHKQKFFDAIEQIVKKKQKKSILAEDEILDEKPSTSAQAQQQLSEIVIYKCKDCSFVTCVQEEFKQHGEREHISAQHKCMVCSANFASAQELGAHARTCKPAIVAKPEDLKLSAQLREIVSEKGDKIWQCDLCPFFLTPFQAEALYHRVFHFYENVDKNQLLPCPLCDKSFRKHSLRFHLHNHTMEKLFKCDLCCSAFSRPYNLKDHIRNMHGKEQQISEETTPDTTSPDKADKKFPCEYCDKVFKNKQSLKIHRWSNHISESTPTEDRPPLLKCSYENCIYATVNRFLLNLHLKTHSKESFKCTKKDCNYIGKSNLHLKRHLQSHEPIAASKLFACKLCKFKTKTRGHIIRHERQHTGEKPFACPYCKHRCSSWDNLRKHILKTEKHAGKFVFECQKCKETLADTKEPKKRKLKEVFQTNSHYEYQQHLKNVHQEIKNSNKEL